MARGIAAADGVTEGLVCVLAAVAPCRSFDIHTGGKARPLQFAQPVTRPAAAAS